MAHPGEGGSFGHKPGEPSGASPFAVTLAAGGSRVRGWAARTGILCGCPPPPSPTQDLHEPQRSLLLSQASLSAETTVSSAGGFLHDVLVSLICPCLKWVAFPARSLGEGCVDVWTCGWGEEGAGAPSPSLGSCLCWCSRPCFLLLCPQGRGGGSQHTLAKCVTLSLSWRLPVLMVLMGLPSQMAAP